MTSRKKIMILTGAGISAASGIPTFRGEDGFWKQTKRYADEDDCMKICTKDFFNKHPAEYWQWHYDFIKLASTCKPNQAHIAVREFQEYCVQNSVNLIQV